MKNAKKEPLFTPKQRIGILTLACVLPLAILVLYYLPHWIPDQTLEASLNLSQQKADSLMANLQAFERKEHQWERDTIALRLHTFDPNTADSLTFRELGLPAWMARNVLRYRAKGGIFRTPDSFRKVYGMNDSLFASLQSYIQIDTSKFAQPDTLRWAQDTTFKTPIFHAKRDTILELNSADTASLQLIRGIGKYTAVQIVRYRQQLGGFVSVEQLREIEMATAVDSIISSFTVCPDSVRTIPVNKSTVERLNRHPYLTFTQAKALYTLRREQVRLHDINTIRTLPEFTEKDLLRLHPYLSFE